MNVAICLFGYRVRRTRWTQRARPACLRWRRRRRPSARDTVRRLWLQVVTCASSRPTLSTSTDCPCCPPRDGAQRSTRRGVATCVVRPRWLYYCSGAGTPGECTPHCGVPGAIRTGTSRRGSRSRADSDNWRSYGTPSARRACYPVTSPMSRRTGPAPRYNHIPLSNTNSSGFILN